MTIPNLILALAALLLMPGPTNTLLAVAGAERGLRASLSLIPFELSAYLAVTVPLALMGNLLASEVPMLNHVHAGLAGIWVLLLAIRMWHFRPDTPGTSVTAWGVFVTTLLNPKGLIFGLVLLPGPELPLRVFVFSLLVTVIAALWAGFGSLATLRPSTAQGAALRLRQVAAVWLALLSMGLLYSAAQAAHLH